MLKTILKSSGCHQKLTEWYATFHARTIQSQMTVDGTNQRETTLVSLQDQHRSSAGGQRGKYQTHNEIKETKLCVSIHNFNPPSNLPSNCHWPFYCKCLNTSGWEDVKVCRLLYDVTITLFHKLSKNVMSLNKARRWKNNNHTKDHLTTRDKIVSSFSIPMFVFCF